MDAEVERIVNLLKQAGYDNVELAEGEDGVILCSSPDEVDVAIKVERL